VDHVSAALGSRNARRRARSESGQAAVELALALPAIVMLLLAIVQFALVARDEVLVVHAAREAARAASLGGSGVDAATRVLPGTHVVIVGGERVGDPVVATVGYRAATDLPLVGPLIPDPWLHATVTMRAEEAR
jgi:hypothetical protein